MGDLTASTSERMNYLRWQSDAGGAQQNLEQKVASGWVTARRSLTACVGRVTGRGGGGINEEEETEENK